MTMIVVVPPEAELDVRALRHKHDPEQSIDRVFAAARAALRKQRRSIEISLDIKQFIQSQMTDDDASVNSVSAESSAGA
jgi:hypothetical protein